MAKTKKKRKKKLLPKTGPIKVEVKPRNPYATPARLRSGSGFHKDKEKEKERKICRKKVEVEDEG